MQSSVVIIGGAAFVVFCDVSLVGTHLYTHSIEVLNIGFHMKATILSYALVVFGGLTANSLADDESTPHQRYHATQRNTEGQVKPAWQAKPMPYERAPQSGRHDSYPVWNKPQRLQQSEQDDTARPTAKPVPPAPMDRSPYFNDEIQMQRYQDLRMEEEAQGISPGGLQRKPIPANGVNYAVFRKPMQINPQRNDQPQDQNQAQGYPARY